MGAESLSFDNIIKKIETTEGKKVTLEKTAEQNEVVDDTILVDEAEK